MRRLLMLSAIAVLALLFSCSSKSIAADSEMAVAPPSKAEPWWKHAVIYEIYPRSFADAKNAGVGNLQGIISKLDYLKDLGVDAIWITPCFPSPQVDFGYDISDYENIAPEYGTLADFDQLVKEAKARNIRILLDLVMNHTSDKHKWFVESRSSKNNPKHDWYIWRDGKLDGPPNNWQSIFGHSAWTLDPKTKQYYYHFFYPEQPDLNWRNPQVKKAMFDVVRFWLDRGVAGFRLDAITTLFEDPNLKDNKVLPGKNVYGDPNMDNENNDHSPQIHEVLSDLRQVINSYPDDRVLVGETYGKDLADLSLMYGKNNDEIQLPMNFQFAYINKLSAPDFRARISEWDSNPAKGWPVYLFNNHDCVRSYNRYGDGIHNDQIAKLMATMLLTLRGTPILYYGEELGMENRDPQSIEEVFDPIGKIGWPKEKGRDGERTPMQWNALANAGFSQAKPWLPVTANFTTHNVASEERDPNSVLNYYKQLIQLRRTKPGLSRGEYIALNTDDKNVLSYLRKSDKCCILIALNMSNATQKIQLKYPVEVPKGKTYPSLLSSEQSKALDVTGELVLKPFGAYIWEIQ